MSEDRTVIEFGPSIGTFQGKDVPAFIVTGTGEWLEFVGTGDSPFDLSQLQSDECIIAPGLIYRPRRLPIYRVKGV